MSQDFTPNLQHARKLLEDLESQIDSFPVEKLMYRAPIIDRIRNESWEQEEIMGLNKWVDGVIHQAKVLDAIIESGIPPKEDPLPTVLNLITFWKIIITSQTPIVGVRMAMGGEKRFNNKVNNPNGNGNENGSSKNVTAFGGYIKNNGKNPVAKGLGKEVWVDVISKGGREWTRIYSKKISHLLAEFREADSYINSDYDSDSESASSSSSSSPNKHSSKEETNSLLITASELLRTASSVDRIPGAPIPALTIHLTRIPSTPEEFYHDFQSPHPAKGAEEEGDEEHVEWPDTRIPSTFQKIRDMGINLVFGDLSNIDLSSDKLKGIDLPEESIPAMRLNLDITTLMGLCSDVLHYTLPSGKAEAARRSLRPPGHTIGNGSIPRGRDGTGKGKGKGKINKEEEDQGESVELRGQSQNSRELYNCILEEMERPFIEEFDQVIRKAWKDQQLRTRSKPSQDVSKSIEHMSMNDVGDSEMPQVEFWTTPQAAQYTYEALSSGPAHGHGYEQRRMRRMLGLEQGDFFEESRYQGNEGVLKGFEVRIFDQDKFVARSVKEVLSDLPVISKDKIEIPKEEYDLEDSRASGKTGFHRTLTSITKLFLDQYYASASARSKGIPTSIANLPNFLQPKKIPAPPIAKISLPFPVVSLHSLHRGAKEGMTTIMMGTATLKEVWGQNHWRVRGWERGWYDWEVTSISDSTLLAGKESPAGADVKLGTREKGHAAVMIFPYRVFGEGKRVRFEQGDYSYPTKDQ
ncbi:uncharacterized protein IL334_007265 [Kwoniella shivajii]|uniref:Uncharacterized protein n=1 Tax=Kwoniella shivajii TaxID=564305 RepID=A0ABZ1D868_9TREE|nr:hypothetical protein IL334_007265 [Kwoniella shivajii]